MNRTAAIIVLALISLCVSVVSLERSSPEPIRVGTSTTLRADEIQATGVNVGSSTGSNLVDVKGSNNQEILESPNTQWHRETSGDNVLDMYATGSGSGSGSGQYVYRFFRHTNTTGIAAIDVLAGNNTSAVDTQIGANTSTWFDPPGFGTTAFFGLGTLSPSHPFMMQLTGTGRSRTTGYFESALLWDTGSYDATTSNQGDMLLDVDDEATKSAGSNTLTHIGIHCLINNADTNLCMWVETGNVQIDTAMVMGHTWWRQGSPTLSAGLLGTFASNLTGEIKSVGASSTTLTFGTNNGSYTTASWCQTTPESVAAGTGDIITATVTPASVTFTCYDSTTATRQNCVNFTYSCSGF